MSKFLSKYKWKKGKAKRRGLFKQLREYDGERQERAIQKIIEASLAGEISVTGLRPRNPLSGDDTGRKSRRSPDAL